MSWHRPPLFVKSSPFSPGSSIKVAKYPIAAYWRNRYQDDEIPSTRVTVSILNVGSNSQAKGSHSAVKSDASQRTTKSMLRMTSKARQQTKRTVRGRGRRRQLQRRWLRIALPRLRGNQKSGRRRISGGSWRRRPTERSRRHCYGD